MVRYPDQIVIVGNTAPTFLDAGKWVVKEVKVENVLDGDQGDYVN